MTTEFDGITSSCTNREDCLYHDVMNYVVIDVLLDFYNYEMGVVLHEKDRKLNNLAHFVMDHIILFTRTNGPKLLAKPADLATDLFNKDLQGDEDIWEETLPETDEFDDDDDESEEWKIDHVSVNTIFSEFEKNHFELLAKPFSNKLFKEFKTYLNSYLEVNRLDDFEFEYIEEFFALIFPQTFFMDNNVDFTQFKKLFSTLFDFIDQNTSIKLAKSFLLYKQDELLEIKRAFLITQDYHENNSYVNFLLSEDATNPSLEEGYFEIVEYIDGAVKLRNVDQQMTYENVDLSVLKTNDLQLGDILHIQLIKEGPRCRLAFLELVYPAASKFFLY